MNVSPLSAALWWTVAATSLLVAIRPEMSLPSAHFCRIRGTVAVVSDDVCDSIFVRDFVFIQGLGLREDFSVQDPWIGDEVTEGHVTLVILLFLSWPRDEYSSLLLSNFWQLRLVRPKPDDVVPLPFRILS